jgi:hypothetical protein
MEAQKLFERIQKRTTLLANSIVFSDNCTTAGCTLALGLTPGGPVSIVCPALAGQTCTYYVHLETQTQITAHDNGIFRFLIDGVAPTPGPTDTSGVVTWISSDPNSTLEIRSYAVIGRVTNTVSSEKHAIEIDSGCRDEDGDGCGATAGLSSIRIDVFRP